MKPDFDAIADDLYRRSASPFRTAPEVRELIAAQLRIAYQEGILDGLRQGETAIAATFAKFGGRVEP